REWGEELLDNIAVTANLLDNAKNMDTHKQSMKTQAHKLLDPALTPSGRMLEIMQGLNQSYFAFAMQRSQQHLDYFTANTSAIPLHDQLATASLESLQEQNRIEQADNIDFDTFLTNWNRF
ncbi:MAG: glutamate--cysteine ligase, partial [Pseudohongiellaceae bacterium]